MIPKLPAAVRLAVTFLVAGFAASIVLAAATAQPRAVGRYGGMIVVGDSFGDAGPLDPTVDGGGAASDLVYSVICEKLYAYGARTQLVPQLAASLPVLSPDKLSYTIQLRRGIVFNDGTPFNAQAVATSLERNATLPDSRQASDLSALGGVTSSGPYTVVIHLTARDAALPDVLAGAAGYIMSPTQLAKLGAGFGTDPVCVGPFMFDHRVAGSNVTVIKSPYYYNKYAVHLDKIVFVPAPDAAASVAALEAGDMQVLWPLDPIQLPAIEGVSGLSVIRTPTIGSYSIRINIGNSRGVGNLPYSSVGTPLASSPALRKAFEEAIDRNSLVRVVFANTVAPGCTPIPPSDTDWYDTSVACTPYAPKDARRLVAASGIPSPTVHLLTATTTSSLLLAQVIQADEAAVGIHVVIDTATNTAVSAAGQAGSFDAMVGASLSGPDPDQLMGRFATSGTLNIFGYSNPRVDLLLANGRKATTHVARQILYDTAEQVIATDRPAIYLGYPYRYVGYSSALSGIELYPDALPHLAFAQYG
jgi:peptide/nickel transport system substrate-binding protein